MKRRSKISGMLRPMPPSFEERESARLSEVLRAGDVEIEVKSEAGLISARRLFEAGRIGPDEKGLLPIAREMQMSDDRYLAAFAGVRGSGGSTLTFRIKNDPEDILWFKLAVGQ